MRLIAARSVTGGTVNLRFGFASGTTLLMLACLPVLGLTPATGQTLGDGHIAALAGAPTQAEQEVGASPPAPAVPLSFADRSSLLRARLQTSKPLVDVAVGDNFSCAVVPRGRVKCWGDLRSFKLGKKAAQSGNPVPVTMPSIRGAVSVDAGWDFACALLKSGFVKCWGSNSDGQLGLTRNTDSKPVPVKGVRKAVSISVAAEYACATLSNGSVKCWGDNARGRLGRPAKRLPGFSGWPSPSPIRVAGVSTAVNVSSGPGHTCALLRNGQVSCWGENYYGEVRGYPTDSGDLMKPQPVAGVLNATAISAGHTSTCVVLTDGSVTCWGNNEYGQIGSPRPLIAPGRITLPPTTVPGVTSAEAISVNKSDSSSPGVCAILRDGGRLDCWGYGAEQGWQVRTIEGATGVTSISLEDTHTCFREGNGVRCWGLNIVGELGIKTRGSFAAPVSVKGL